MFNKSIALACVAAGLMVAGINGCESTPTANENQPPIGELDSGNRGVQAKNIDEMAEIMAEKILQCPAIVQDLREYRGPGNERTKLTVAMEPLSSDRGEDFSMAIAEMRVILNTHARDRLAFTEDPETLRRFQAKQYGVPQPNLIEDDSRNPAAPQDPGRFLPGYVLHGKVYTLGNRATTYQLFTFSLTRIMPGATAGKVEWEGMYKVHYKN